MSGKIKDLKNQRFDKLVVLCFDGMDKSGNARWLCRCDCGETVSISAPSLKAKRPHSCPRCKSISNWEKRSTHRESKTRLYNIYYGMKHRCEKAYSVNFHNYGGRGITICDEWKNYEAFAEWAHSNGYSDTLTLDRIDNDKGYSPSNCRWVTYREQSNNTRSNHWISFNGETRTLSEWARLLGINKSTLCERLNRRGWSVERALTT